jgi:hypothetical protein
MALGAHLKPGAFERPDLGVTRVPHQIFGRGDLQRRQKIFRSQDLKEPTPPQVSASVFVVFARLEKSHELPKARGRCERAKDMADMVLSVSLSGIVKKLRGLRLELELCSSPCYRAYRI